MNHACTIKKTLLMTAAIATVAFPLFVSAGATDAADGATSICYDRGSADVVRSPERLYERIKAVSREMCGSTDLLIASSVRRVADHKACYKGTLEAAIQRLDDPAVSTLHRRDVASL
jgi:UrcA family protein